MHDQKHALRGFGVVPKAWRDGNLPHYDGILDLAPLVASTVAVKNIPVHVAFAANRLMPGGCAKRDEHGGDGEQDGGDLVASMHARGIHQTASLASQTLLIRSSTSSIPG